MSDRVREVRLSARGPVTEAVRKSVIDYAKDVRKLLERVRQRPGSYSAALHAGDRYPTFPLETPLGAVTVRLLSDTQGVVESSALTIYGVHYRVFAHLTLEDGAWVRYEGVTGFDRVDHNWSHDCGPAKRRFDAVVLPAVTWFLDDPAIKDARLAAQAVRLIWTSEVHDEPARRDLERLIAELKKARADVTRHIAAAYDERQRIDAHLAIVTPPRKRIRVVS